MGGRDARAVLLFVLLSLTAGSAYRAWTRDRGPTLAERLRRAAEESRLEEERGAAGDPVLRQDGGDQAPQGSAGGGADPIPRGAARGGSAAPLRLGSLDPDRASVEEWERLPGIGPALAARIVADRASRGPFGGPAGLGRVRGIGPKTLQRLRPYLRPAPADSGSPIAN